jgi:hypothetical protein
MDHREIRAAFLASEGAETKLRRFRDERLGRLVASELPISLLKGPRFLFHIFPVAAFTGEVGLSPQALADACEHFHPATQYKGRDFRLNLDGMLLTRPPAPEGYRSYVQVFRSGVVESVLADLKPEVEQGKHCIRPNVLEDQVRTLLNRQFGGLRALGVTGPLIVAGALLGARGLHLLMPGDSAEPEEHAIDRDVAVFPEEWLGEVPANANAVVRHLFDELHLAGGNLRNVEA